MPLPALAGMGRALTATLGLETSGFTSGIGRAAAAAKKFGGTVEGALKTAKENAMPLWAGLQLVQGAFDALLGPSEVLRDLMVSVRDVWGGLVDSILASFEPVWNPLIQTFSELVNELLPEMRPFLKEIADVVADFVIPVFKEYREEFKLLLGLVVEFMSYGIAAAFTAIGVAAGGLGEAIRTLKGAWDALAGPLGEFSRSDVGKDLAAGFDAIADAVGGAADAMWKLIHGFDELERRFGGPGKARWTDTGRFDPLRQPRDPLQKAWDDFWGTFNPANWWGFQHGGVATRPTVGLLAETEPEAVIPLSKLGGVLGSAGGGGGSVTVVFNDGAIRLGGPATAQDARDLVDLIREELRRHQATAVNTLR